MTSARQLLSSQRVREFIKFCIVGGTGVIVDMAILCLLADPRFLAFNVTLSKIGAAEMAMINNFIWNELWTFRQPTKENDRRGIFRRFLFFNIICSVGIGLAVLFLHLFYTGLQWNLYISNLLAIILVTLWNFGMNARFNWGRR